MGDMLEYEEFTFWENLARKLARRDLVQLYGHDAVRRMSDAERIEREAEIEERYWGEFREHGVDRLTAS